MIVSINTEFDDEMTLNVYCETYGGSVEHIRMSHSQITRLLEIVSRSPKIEEWADKMDSKEAVPAKKINAKNGSG